jgi:hypothetical protein
MSVELPFVVGGSGGVLASFGAFLLLWERYEYCVGGCKLGRGGRTTAWVLLILGLLLVFASLWIPGETAPPG